MQKELLKITEAEYGQNYRAHCLEIYKLYVTMADNISVRRQTTNSFFLTINTALIAFLGYVKPGIGQYAEYLVWLNTPVGVVLCYCWYRLIRSYRELNSGKFKVIHAIEQHLPLSPYDAEWELLGRGKDLRQYLPFTRVEMYVPLVFLSIYAMTFFIFFPWLYLLSVCWYALS